MKENIELTQIFTRMIFKINLDKQQKLLSRKYVELLVKYLHKTGSLQGCNLFFHLFGHYLRAIL